MGTCVHFSRSLPSNSWWQTMVGWHVLSRPSAAEGGGRRPAFTGLATQPYSATEVDGWQHKLSRVSQNRAAVQLPNPYLPIARLAGHSAGETKSYQARRESSPRSVREPPHGSCLRSDQTNRQKGGTCSRLPNAKVQACW